MSTNPEPWDNLEGLHTDTFVDVKVVVDKKVMLTL